MSATGTPAAHNAIFGGELIVQNYRETAQPGMPGLYMGHVGVNANKHCCARLVELDVVMQIVTMVRQVLKVLGIKQGRMDGHILTRSHATSPVVMGVT
jgi:hypothetical protein